MFWIFYVVVWELSGVIIEKYKDLKYIRSLYVEVVLTRYYL
jgi:hypothetical protein